MAVQSRMRIARWRIGRFSEMEIRVRRAVLSIRPCWFVLEKTGRHLSRDLLLRRGGSSRRVSLRRLRWYALWLYTPVLLAALVGKMAL